MPRALTGLERAQCRDQCVDFGDGERPVGERGALPAGILQVALDPHGAEQEPPDGDARCVGDQRMLEHSLAAGAPDARLVVRPAQGGGPAGVVARREADALVLRVGEQVDDALRPRVEVDLHRVARRVAEEPRAIAGVRGRVVETRLGEREHRTSRRRRQGELREHHERGDHHEPFGETVSARRACGRRASDRPPSRARRAWSGCARPSSHRSCARSCRSADARCARRPPARSAAGG